MPGFTLTRYARAPVEEVWKLLFDPTRFPEWWAGVETVRTGPEPVHDVAGRLPRLPDAAAPAHRRSRGPGDRVVPGLRHRRRLAARRGADGTPITVRVDLPEAEAHRLDGQRELITTSLANLSELAQGRERQVKR